MHIPDEALTIIDSVTNNRTAFMVEAAVRAAKAKLRQREDEEIARWCAQSAEADTALDEEFRHTLLEGIQER